ncbi:MAG: acyl-CoA/acyl-ACP dehydrogenase, partial [Alphaproteobacteria bacterium]|nr:acyl-CoA/acyl-ACP dehydrogenase [Alphaproteobacteria bacterium]
MTLPISLLEEALAAAEAYLDDARGGVAARVQAGGRTDPAALERDQFAAHGFAWIATYVAGLREMLGWARRLEASDALTELDRLVLQAAFGEYLAQLSGGIAVSQGEVVRPADLGLDGAALRVPAVGRVAAEGNSNAARMEIAALLAEGQRPSDGLDDESLALVRDQFRRFADERIVGPAHGWHSRDELIPMSVIGDMADMGVFGLTVPEEWGGLGMGKVAMCVVTEELSRGYIGVGSLGTRSEIAAELIRLGGTEEQKERWLADIASGAVLPTAVFTEPDVGSDLGGVRTRAVRDGSTYRISGAKTWITHAARADLMTLLARTDPDTPGYRGLSMFLAPKTRGDDGNPFPDPGIDGGEIPVLGYRGMKEYDIGFDGFEVDAGDLLGREEGQGFKQLMATFESARIQT